MILNPLLLEIDFSVSDSPGSSSLDDLVRINVSVTDVWYMLLIIQIWDNSSPLKLSLPWPYWRNYNRGLPSSSILFTPLQATLSFSTIVQPTISTSFVSSPLITNWSIRRSRNWSIKRSRIRIIMWRSWSSTSSNMKKVTVETLASATCFLMCKTVYKSEIISPNAMGKISRSNWLEA